MKGLMFDRVCRQKKVVVALAAAMAFFTSCRMLQPCVFFSNSIKMTEQNEVPATKFDDWSDLAAVSPEKNWSWRLRSFFGAVIEPASAAESFSQQDLEAVRQATEQAKQMGADAARKFIEECSGCRAAGKIAPEQISELAEHHRQTAVQVLQDAEKAKALLKAQPQNSFQKAGVGLPNDPQPGGIEADRSSAGSAAGVVEKTFVFVSRSLGEAALHRVFKENAGREDVEVVLRGILQGEKLSDVMTEIHRMVRKVHEQIGQTVNIILDPTLFEQFSITAVPTVVRARSTADQAPNTSWQALASVKGLSNDAWLTRQLEASQTGDLGQQGPVYEISEPDMIEEMKRRAAGIDWEAKKQQAIANYWQNQKFAEYEQAPQNRTFEIDPSVLVTADIKDADGLVLQKAGERINPLDIRPFEKEVVFFDATNPEQRTRVLEYVEQADQIPRIYVSSRFDPDKGWEGYEELTALIKVPLYQLQPKLAERFGIVRLPSVVRADNVRKVFVVTELGPQQDSNSRKPNQTKASGRENAQ